MAEQRSTEIVPGMAEAIEHRRVELGLRPGRMAELAGVTPQGLVAVRRGYRRDYQDKVRLGLARALQWEPDAIERLLRGDAPVPLPDQPDDDPDPGGSSEVADLRREVAGLRGDMAEMRELLMAALSGDTSQPFVEGAPLKRQHGGVPEPYDPDEGREEG